MGCWPLWSSWGAWLGAPLCVPHLRLMGAATCSLSRQSEDGSGGPAAPGRSLLALGAALRPPHTIFLGSLPWGDTLGGLSHLSCTAHSSLAGPVSAVSSTW